MAIDPSDILTPDEAAVAMKVPRRTVLLMCQRGDLAGARKAGRQWRIPRWCVDSYFAGGADADLQEGKQVAGSDLPQGQSHGLDRGRRKGRRGGVRGTQTRGDGEGGRISRDPDRASVRGFLRAAVHAARAGNAEGGDVEK